MKGKAVSAHSNAQTLKGAVESSNNGQPLHRRHNWIANGEAEFGPMEISFESAANLISLNIDFTFSCKDSNSLLSEKEVPEEESKEQSSLVAEDSVRIEDGLPDASKPDEAHKNLGQFTIKGIESQQINEESGKAGWNQQAQASNSLAKDESSSFLPLIVHKHKGAQFNNSH